MPPSLKKQRRNENKRDKKHQDRKAARKFTARELQLSAAGSLRAVSRKTGVCHTVLKAMQTSITTQDKCTLKPLTSPVKRPGAQPVLSFEEETLIVRHCLKAARRGFALTEGDLKGIMANIANDGRKKTYKNGVPSGDAVRSFRARHPELTYRRAENKELVKLRGEEYLHAKTYEDALRSVAEDFPRIFDDGDLVWNMDETHIDGEVGKRPRVINAGDTHHGGFCTRTAGTGNGRHVNVVIAVSASGKKDPPFFIIEGKRNMSNWYLTLETEDYNFEDEDLETFKRKRWFSLYASVAMVENGSMDMDIISIFMKHLNRFVRKFVPSERNYLLLLEGHSSRQGMKWLEIAKHRQCEIVQSPANTSNFSQPCDADVNKRFKDTVRRVRDKFCVGSNGRTDTRTIQTKLMFGIRSFEAVSPADISRPWEVTGLWPMDFRFTERYKRRKDNFLLTAEKKLATLDVGGPTASIMSVKQRHSDKETFDFLASIVDNARIEVRAKVSTALQNASVCLSNHQTINKILISRELSVYSTAQTGMSENRSVVSSKLKNFALSAGAPAQYLIHRDILENSRAQEREEAGKQAANSLLCAESAKKKRERDQEKQRRAEMREAAKRQRNENSSRMQTMRRADSTKVNKKRGECQEMGASLALAAFGTRDGGSDGNARGWSYRNVEMTW